MTADWDAGHEPRVRGQSENPCHDASAHAPSLTDPARRPSNRDSLRHPHFNRHREPSCPRVVAPPRNHQSTARLGERDQRQEPPLRHRVALGNGRHDDATVDEVASQRFANLHRIALEQPFEPQRPFRHLGGRGSAIGDAPRALRAAIAAFFRAGLGVEVAESCDELTPHFSSGGVRPVVAFCVLGRYESVVEVGRFRTGTRSRRRSSGPHPPSPRRPCRARSAPRTREIRALPQPGRD